MLLKYIKPMKTLFSYFIAHFNLHSLMFYIVVSEQNYAVNVKSMHRMDEIAFCFLKD